MIMTLRYAITLVTLAGMCAAGDAAGNELVFSGQNASLFPDANPADTSAMMNSVVKPNNPSPISSVGTFTTSQFILQSLESQISNKIFSEIENSSPGDNETRTLSDGSGISWTNVGGVITVTVTQPDGTQTTVTL